MEDRTRAICGDCMDYLKTLEDKSIPLVVADPPYGIGAGCAIGGAVRAKTHEYHCYEDKAVDLNLLSELIRVGRHVVIWGANHFISRLPIDASCWLVWDKMNGATDFADCELAWTNLEKPVRMFRFKWQGMLKGRQDVRQERIHPNEKPIALYRWIYNLVGLETCRGGVLDPFMGSGSSRIAAWELGIPYVGIERDKVYYDLQEQRFKEWTGQQLLDFSDVE